MKRIYNTFLGADAFKLIAFFASLLIVCPLTASMIEPYLKLLHLYAFIVVVVDLFTQRRILKNKGRIIAIVFTASYLITLFANKNLLNFSGLSNFCYLLEALFIVYSYDHNHEKANQMMTAVICTVISVANLAGIWMFYQKYYVYIEGRGYIGMFPSENRLSGLFGNPNVLGMVCMIAIILSLIQFAQVAKPQAKKYYILLIFINVVTLILSNSRTQIYSCLAMVGVLSFMQMYRTSKNIKGIIRAVIGAILCVLLAFGGVKVLQYGVSFFDLKYDYYVQNIESGNHTSKANLSVTTVYNSAGKPTLAWNAVENAKYYEVYRSEQESGTYVQMYETDGTTYTNSSAEQDVTYYYYVVAVLENSSSIKSDKVSATCIAQDITFAVKQDCNEEGKPRLKWNLPENATSYEVYRAASPNDAFVKVFTTEGKTYTHVSAENGHTYYYYVIAVMPDGMRIRSDVMSADVALSNGESTQETIEKTQEATEESQVSTKPNKITVTRKTDTSALNGRMEIWKKGLQVFEAKPLFGCGLDNVAQTLSDLGKETLAVKGNLHNTYLELLTTTGVAGVGCLVVYLICMFKEVVTFFKLKENKRWILGSVYLACIVAFMVDGVADSTLLASVYPTSLAFWIVASQFACLLEKENDSEKCIMKRRGCK